MNREELAWVAGFLEGEGTIGIYKHTQSKYGYYYEVPLIEATNTERALLEALQNMFGGSVLKVYSAGYEKTGGKANKACYKWRVTHQKAHKVVQSIIQYLKGSKREGAQAILEWYASGKHNPGGMRNKGRDVRGRFISRPA